MVTYKLLEKEVNNPFLKVLALLIPITFVTVSLPALIPMHLILRKIKRNGFWFRHQIIIGIESFKKQEDW